MTGRGEGAASYADSRRARPAARGLIGFLGVSALAGLALAPLAGWLWVALSDPPQAPLYADGGVYLGEQALNQQAGVTLWFIVIGAGFGAVAGLAVSLFGARFGWLTVVAVLVLCLVGTLVSRYVGAHVFGSDPKAEVAHAATGDLIRLGVQLDTWVAYLGWPIGGALGALAGISGWNRRDMAPVSPTLDPFVAFSTDQTTGNDNGRTYTSTGDAGPR